MLLQGFDMYGHWAFDSVPTEGLRKALNLKVRTFRPLITCNDACCAGVPARSSRVCRLQARASNGFALPVCMLLSISNHDSHTVHGHGMHMLRTSQ